ncbi:hypothetical protein TRFO_24104 [Tritrichomonas foetus]|uniref:non-specific serine/threonine protein kinase n=1 Tax=Tritrichomonas foetus TaxID=1144522 RepID=A0A1J4K856_9EUKA|nr:hypothetical protein TRFO_24104 [Tritrichomonas foetus]|eukprot:OHT07681.1 hypothetical protein TRFO_24104 [Tritrichomonas foetus]
MQNDIFTPTHPDESPDDYLITVAQISPSNDFIPTDSSFVIPGCFILPNYTHVCFVRDSIREGFHLYVNQQLNKNIYFCLKCGICINNEAEDLEKHFQRAHPVRKKVKKKRGGGGKKRIVVDMKTLPVSAVKEEKKPTSFENYSISKILGQGAFGSVHKGFDTDTGKPVAIKAIPLDNQNSLSSIQSEIEIMSHLDNEHIVKYIGSHKTHDFLYIVMEYAEQGSLQSTQKRFGNFTERLAAQYIQQILLGLQYLHSQGIIHHDIKEANILLINNVAKLSDFGISINIKSDMNSQSDLQCSPYWTAPEVINDNIISTESDIWSLGITAIEMITGNPPYIELNPIPAMYKIAQCHETPLPDNISPEFRDFLQSCLNPDKDFRLSADQLLEHRWIKKNNEDDDSDNIEYVRRKSLTAGGLSFIPQKSQQQQQSSQSKSNEKKEPTELDRFVENSNSDNLFSDDSEEAGDKCKIAKAPSNLDQFFESDSDNSDSFEFGNDKEPFPKLTPLISIKPALSPQTLDNFIDDDDDGNIEADDEKEMADIEDFVEDDIDDDQDFGVFGTGPDSGLKIQIPSYQPNAPKLVTGIPLQPLASLEDDDSDDLFGGGSDESLSIVQLVKPTPADTMAQLDDIFDDDDDDIQQERERQNQLMKSVINEIDKLPTMCSDHKQNDDFYNICYNLMKTFEIEPFLKANLADFHGAIPIVTILQSRNQKLLEAALPFIYIATADQTDTQNMLCLLGILPYLFEYVIDVKYSALIQEISLKILHNFCISMKRPLQMFISAGGLLKIAKVFETYPHKERPILTKLIVEIIDAVFNFHSSTPKSCFARIIAQSNLVSLLGKRYVDLDPDDPLMEILCRIFEVLSTGETQVKLKMAEKEFIDDIFTKARCKASTNNEEENNNTAELDDFNLFIIIKCMNNLAMDKNVVPKLWKTKLITRLIEHLHIGEHSRMNFMQNTCFSAIFHISLMLTTEKLPQILPLIPILSNIIMNEQPVKELATMLFLEIINNHSKDENISTLLEKNNGLETLLFLLEKNPHKEQVLASYDIWAMYQPSIIEKSLIENINTFTSIIASVFSSDTISLQSQFANKLLMICDKCQSLTKSLADTKLVQEIIKRLNSSDYDSAPELRKSLISLILAILLAATNPKKMATDFRIDIVGSKFLNDPSQPVRNLAIQLLQTINSKC